MGGKGRGATLFLGEWCSRLSVFVYGSSFEAESRLLDGDVQSRSPYAVIRSRPKLSLETKQSLHNPDKKHVCRRRKNEINYVGAIL